jgi:hypothetical protein
VLREWRATLFRFTRWTFGALTTIISWAAICTTCTTFIAFGTWTTVCCGSNITRWGAISRRCFFACWRADVRRHRWRANIRRHRWRDESWTRSWALFHARSYGRQRHVFAFRAGNAHLCFAQWEKITAITTQSKAGSFDERNLSVRDALGDDRSDDLVEI